MRDWTVEEKTRIAGQLERMARSPVFAHAGRMFPLLQYLVDAELDGTSMRLNQYRIAMDVLGRDETFDPGTDSIVRVEIGRLRNKLREFYADEGYGDSVTIDLPKGTYSPLIRINTSAPATDVVPVPEQDIRFCRTPDDVTLAYSMAGAGYPLVKTANWMTHLQYDYESPLWHHWLASLSRSYRLVRYDNRGFGLSDRDVGDFTFEDWVADLETVVDAAGLKRFALLGMSQGAMAAVAFAARYPERVSHLVLFGGFIQGGYRLGDAETAERMRVLEDVIRVGWGESHSTFRQIFGSLLMPSASSEQLRWFDEAQRASTSPGNAERFFKLTNNTDVSDLAAQVRVPTLILHGKDEIGIPFDRARHTACLIPGARLIPLDSDNHVLFADEPAWSQFLEAVTGFLPVQ